MENFLDFPALLSNKNACFCCKLKMGLQGSLHHNAFVSAKGSVFQRLILFSWHVQETQAVRQHVSRFLTQGHWILLVSKREEPARKTGKDLLRNKFDELLKMPQRFGSKQNQADLRWSGRRRTLSLLAFRDRSEWPPRESLPVHIFVVAVISKSEYQCQTSIVRSCFVAFRHRSWFLQLRLC